MASIHRIETGDGPRWRVRWRNPADPTLRSATVRTAEAAKKVKLAAESAHDLGRPYLGPQGEAALEVSRRLNLRDLVREYLRDRRRAGRAEASIYQADVALTLFLQTLSSDDLELIPSERLTMAALGRYYDVLREERGCSLLTARDRVAYVQRWWKWMGESDQYGDRVPRPRRIELASPPPALDPVAPTWLEMDQAIACAWRWYQHLMTFARFTGLRGEDQILKLRRDDLDLNSGVLRIRPELGKTQAERRGRVIPVSRYLLALVPEWPVDPDGWLIHIPPSTRHGAPKRRAWNHQVSGAWRRAGVRGEVWDTQPTADGARRNGHPLHAFRRGFITGLRQLGVPLEDVQYLVGHQMPGGVTTDRYTDPKQVRQLGEAVALVPDRVEVQVLPIAGGGHRRSSPGS